MGRLATASAETPRITVVIGTRAQLIKMAPVLQELERRELPFRLLFTGQHRETMEPILQEFGIGTTPEQLFDGHEASSVARMVGWLPRALPRLIGALRATRRTRNLVLVHGDTLSTLLGAVAGRLAGATVAHVEAGLRSFNLLHPFPEELVRLAVFRLSHVAYCPGPWACGNLVNYPLEQVDTGANTLLDAVRWATGRSGDQPVAAPERYGVVSIHRFENIYRRRRLAAIVELLNEVAERVELVFVLHPATRARLRRSGLLEKLATHPAIHLTPRMTYVPFMGLLHGARFVLTDGGSNQEELSYLNKPTVLLRSATERKEGLDNTVLLSNYDRKSILAYIDAALEQDTGAEPMPLTGNPSARLVDHLEREWLGQASMTDRIPAPP